MRFSYCGRLPFAGSLLALIVLGHPPAERIVTARTVPKTLKICSSCKSVTSGLSFGTISRRYDASTKAMAHIPDIHVCLLCRLCRSADRYSLLLVCRPRLILHLVLDRLLRNPLRLSFVFDLSRFTRRARYRSGTSPLFAFRGPNSHILGQ